MKEETEKCINLFNIADRVRFINERSQDNLFLRQEDFFLDMILSCIKDAEKFILSNFELLVENSGYELKLVINCKEDGAFKFNENFTNEKWGII